MDQPVLELRGLTVSLPGGADRRHAVENVSLSVNRGEIVCIVGESGSGKSVTAFSVMGLLAKALRPRALAARHVPMDRRMLTPAEAKAALTALPPLIKGYLRLGGFVGDGAVIDDQFNTTDVCIVVKTDLVTEKYFRHYERAAASSRDE